MAVTATPPSGRPPGPAATAAGDSHVPAADANFLGWRVPLPPLPPKAPASDVAKLLAFLVVALACGALGVAIQSVAFAGLGVVSVALGILVCHVAPVERAFRDLPGWIAGLLVGIVYLMVAGLLNGSTHLALPYEAGAFLALVLVGMDWQRADRLRPIVLLSGVFVAPLVAKLQVESVVLAVLWLVTALGALWVLQSDLDHGGRQATRVPLGPGDDQAPGMRPAELARLVGIAVLVAVGIALLVGSPSCDKPTPRPPINNFGNLGNLGNQGGRAAGAGGAGGASGGNASGAGGAGGSAAGAFINGEGQAYNGPYRNAPGQPFTGDLSGGPYYNASGLRYNGPYFDRNGVPFTGPYVDPSGRPYSGTPPDLMGNGTGTPNDPAGGPYANGAGQTYSGPYLNEQGQPFTGDLSGGPYVNRKGETYAGPYSNAQGTPFNGPYIGYGNGTSPSGSAGAGASGFSTGPGGTAIGHGPYVNDKGESYDGPYTNDHGQPFTGDTSGGPYVNDKGATYDGPYVDQNGNPYMGPYTGPINSGRNGPYVNDHGQAYTGPYVNDSGQPYTGDPSGGPYRNAEGQTYDGPYRNAEGDEFTGPYNQVQEADPTTGERAPNGADGSSSDNNGNNNGNGRDQASGGDESGNGNQANGGGDQSNGADQANGGDPSGQANQPSTPPDLSGVLKVVLVVVVVALLAGIAFLLLRSRHEDEDDEDSDRTMRGQQKRAERKWAIETLARITREGTARGRPRDRAETVLGYTDELGAGVLPDERMHDVGRVLSDAFYGFHPTTEEQRRWADGVIDEVIARPFEPEPEFDEPAEPAASTPR